MLERVRLILKNNNSRETFFAVVGTLYPEFSEEYKFIERAYDTAKSAFRGITRDDGKTRYFEHLRGVALIGLVYLQIHEPNQVASFLLHDIIEDVDEWNEERLALEFNKEVATLVWWVTKPPVDLYKNKEERNRAYHARLNDAPREAKIIKLADRLHNVLTLWDVDPRKQRRKVIETQDFYLPIATQEIVLFYELEQALTEVESSWKDTTE